jgi:hypothetical protein
MVRSELLSRPLLRVMLLLSRPNTVFGILSDLSLLLVCSVVWIRSSLSLDQRFCTWVPVWSIVSLHLTFGY